MQASGAETPATADAGVPPLPPTAAHNQQQQAEGDGLSSSMRIPSAADLDSLHYADLPLGLLSPTVLEYGTAAGSPLAAGRRRLLCYFLHRHLEFRLPEVEALASLESRGGPQASTVIGSGGPAVVWEKPFANRVRSCLLGAATWDCPSCLAEGY